MVHVLIEVSGGVVSNVLTEGEATVWLRDYDDLREEGVSGEEAEQALPILHHGSEDEIPPASFTRRQGTHVTHGILHNDAVAAIAKAEETP